MRKRLTALEVSKAGPGRHGDGNGLYLEVGATGSRSWVLRTVAQGKRRDIGLGSAILVPLKDARDLATRLRRVARDGGDPIAERDKGKRIAPTFEEAARKVHEDRIAAGCRNGKHVADWLSAVERYAFPAVGNRQVQHITEADVLRVVQPIWLEKPETARRVLQRVRTILEWARVAGHRDGVNPADGVRGALPKQRDKTNHFAALPWQQMPALWPRLCEADGMGALALRFAILTTARSGEVRFARWREIDLDAAVWTIPADRMKAGREHRVPLSSDAVAILERVRELASGTESLVFPSAKRGAVLSDMTLSAVLKRLDVPVTPHGFRSTFRDWAEEETAYPHEVKEAALAHTVKNKAEAAYRRTDLFEKRRTMMADWAGWVCDGA